MQPPLQSLPKIRSLTLTIFHLPIPLLLIHKIILTISSIPLWVYTSAIFHLPIFAYSHPYNLHQNYFPTLAIYPIQTASRDQWSRDSCDDWQCFNSFNPLCQSMDRNTRAHNHWFLIASSLWWKCMQSEQKTLQFIFFFTLNLFSLIPYPINTIARTHIPL